MHHLALMWCDSRAQPLDFRPSMSPNLFKTVLNALMENRYCNRWPLLNGWIFNCTRNILLRSRGFPSGNITTSRNALIANNSVIWIEHERLNICTSSYAEHAGISVSITYHISKAAMLHRKYPPHPPISPRSYRTPSDGKLSIKYLFGRSGFEMLLQSQLTRYQIDCDQSAEQVDCNRKPQTSTKLQKCQRKANEKIKYWWSLSLQEFHFILVFEWTMAWETMFQLTM